MEQDFLVLSLAQLQGLHNKADTELKQSLLNGTSWEEVRDKRMIVTRLAREIWRKREILFHSSTPSDFQLRAE
jgi:hypothetical protein